MKSYSDIWDSPSPLPLVSYIPGAAEHASRTGTDILAKEKVGPIAGLPLEVVGNVLHENYKKRAEEAKAESRKVEKAIFYDDHSLNESVISVSEYANFRFVDADLHSSLGKRAILFLSSQHPLRLNAYEIYARQGETGESFDSLIFARMCLEGISEHLRRTNVEHELRDSHDKILPKLTRVTADSNGNRFGVITTKETVGIIECGNGDTFSLKSRKAGAFMLDLVEKYDNKDVLDFLAKYRRSQGRSEELMEARRALAEILQEQPDLVKPVVESVYLARNGEIAA